jgi:sugar phosphate isomerase/epimerase
MKTCFSTLACPTWALGQVVSIAARSGYNGIELRFLEGEDSLWKLAQFQGAELGAAKRMISEHGLVVACVGTSCRFHSPDTRERAEWIVEGVRMAELASALGAPGIRVFGDKIQPGANRASTRSWIAESIQEVASKIEHYDVEVWLETHGDFASSTETMSIIRECERQDVGVVWDPANAFTDGDEPPGVAPESLGRSLRHLHLRDLRCSNGEWKAALTGEGEFALREILSELDRVKYSGFVSFEWEKKWHPELAEPEVAIPQFAKWFRQNTYER